MLRTRAEVANIVVATGGRIGRLRKVASVRNGSHELRSLALFDGKGAVSIDVIEARN